MRSPTLVAALVALALAGSLAACAPDDHGLDINATATPSGTVGAGTFAPDDDPVNDAIGLNCRELVADVAIYEWGSGNFAVDVDYEPAAGTDAAEIADDGGLACRWLNLSSGETLEVAAVALSDDELLDRRVAFAAEGEPVSDWNAEGWFSFDGTQGHVNAVSGDYWLSATSTWFYQPGDATLIVNAAVSALG
jgi:hypothetical protein